MNKKFIAVLLAAIILAAAGCSAPSSQASETSQASAAMSTEEYRTELKAIQTDLSSAYNDFASVDTEYKTPGEYIEMTTEYITLMKACRDVLNRFDDLVPPEEYTYDNKLIIAEKDKQLAFFDESIKYSELIRDFYQSFYIDLENDRAKYEKSLNSITDTAVNSISVYENDTDAELRKAYFTTIAERGEALKTVLDQCRSGVDFSDEFAEGFIVMLNNGIKTCESISGLTAPDYIKLQHNALSGFADDLKKDLETILELYTSLNSINRFAEEEQERSVNIFNGKLDEYINKVTGP